MRPGELREALDELPALDQHAHLLARPETPWSLEALLTESQDPGQVGQVRDHPSFHRARRDLGQLLAGGDVDREGPHHRLRLMRACRLRGMLVDDGFRFPGALSLEQHAVEAGCPVHRILRVETLAEEVARDRPGFATVRERFRAGVQAAAEGDAVALKTIAAYRGGLDLSPVPAQVARDAYDAWVASPSPRLVGPTLTSFFVFEALEATRDALPLQVHVGVGDRDLDLARGNPARLRPLLEDPRAADVPVVLLHCYPFVREASYLASVYPNVHIDLSLTLLLAGHRGDQLVLEALDLAPCSKLLFATDASRRPEMFFLAASWWRDALGSALWRLIELRLIDPDVALVWAGMVLSENARLLYGV